MNSNSNSSKKGGFDISTSIITKFPFKLCSKNVSDNAKAILRSLMDHIKCNHLNHNDKKYLQDFNEPWYCLSCINMHFPLVNSSSQKWVAFISNNSKQSLILKRPPDLALFKTNLTMPYLKTTVIPKM